MSVDIYYNGIKTSQINIKPDTTVGKLKRSIIDWLRPQNIHNYTLRMIFNNREELNPIVFDTFDYDDVDFSSRVNQLNGSVLIITPAYDENWEKLPDDIIAQMLSQKDGETVLAMCQANNKLRKVCNTRTNNIFRPILIREFPALDRYGTPIPGQSRYGLIGDLREHYRKIRRADNSRLNPYEITTYDDVYVYMYIDDNMETPHLTTDDEKATDIMDNNETLLTVGHIDEWIYGNMPDQLYVSFLWDIPNQEIDHITVHYNPESGLQELYEDFDDVDVSEEEKEFITKQVLETGRYLPGDYPGGTYNWGYFNMLVPIEN